MLFRLRVPMWEQNKRRVALLSQAKTFVPGWLIWPPREALLFPVSNRMSAVQLSSSLIRLQYKRCLPGWKQPNGTVRASFEFRGGAS